MRKIFLFLAALTFSLHAPAEAQGPKLGKNGGVGSATSTYSSGEPTGGTYAINGTTGAPTFTGPMTLNGPDGFWINPNPFPSSSLPTGQVHRIKNRMQIGYATQTSGDFCFPARTGCTSTGASTKDWYEQLETATHPYSFRTSWSQLAVGATNGGIAVLGFARSSDVTDPVMAGFQEGIGGWFAGYNNNTTLQQHVAGLYAVGIREPGTGMTVTGTGTIGGEVDIVNRGNVVQIVPGNIYPTTGFTTGWQVNSGGSYTGANTASAGITLGNNRANFNAGIVIAQNAINGVTLDGGGAATGGGGSAIRMGAFQQVEWWNNAGSAPTSLITSEQLTPANAQAIRFQDSGIVFGGPVSASRSFEMAYPGGATGAWLRAWPAYGANVATLDVSGTNNDIQIRPAGLGAIRLTSSTGFIVPEIAAAAATVPPAGTQTIFIDTADHKLKRKDSAGTVVIIN